MLAIGTRAQVMGAAFVGLALFPLVANPYLLYVVNLGLIYVVLAVGLNLLLGFGGQFAFASAALFGIGAYATGLLQVRLQWPYLLAAAAGALCTTAVGLLVAMPALRLSGLYLALPTHA